MRRYIGIIKMCELFAGIDEARIAEHLLIVGKANKFGRLHRRHGGGVQAQIKSIIERICHHDHDKQDQGKRQDPLGVAVDPALHSLTSFQLSEKRGKEHGQACSSPVVV